MENDWPLCDYVFRDDGYYQYELYDTIYQEDRAVTTYYVNLTSQKWFDGQYIAMHAHDMT